MTASPTLAPPRRAILVDDELGIIRVLPRILRQWDWDVRVTVRAVEALDLLRAGPADLLITDMNLRGMDGCQLARRVVKEWPEIRVLMITGGDIPIDRLDDCAGMPMLGKPLTFESFREKIDQVMRAPPWRPMEG